MTVSSAKIAGNRMNTASNLPKGLSYTFCILNQKTVQNYFVIHDGEDLTNFLMILLFHLQ